MIARRFDERYGRVDPAHPIFPEPESLLSRSGTILGLDGNKMSKSRGNTIELGMTADEPRDCSNVQSPTRTATSPTTP